MKLIFFGGCFDPPHKGHYEIIRKCANKCHQFLIMPTIHSPLKNNTSATTPHHILQMLELLIKDIGYAIEIDTFDYSRPGPSYTVDTVRYLQKKYSEYSISMIVGADQLMNFQNWKGYNEIINTVHIIAFNRENYDYTPLPKMNIKWIEDFNMDISSVAIRKDFALGGEPKENVLTPSVKNYIIENNVYGSE